MSASIWSGSRRGSSDIEGVQAHGAQRLRRYWLIVDLHSPIDEVVGPAPLCYSLPHLRYRPITLERAAFYVPAQNPLRAVASLVQHIVTEHLVALLFDIVVYFLCVTPYPCWYRGSVGQDRICIVIAEPPITYTAPWPKR